MKTRNVIPALFIFCVLNIQSAYAQPTLTLEQSIDSALKNNLSIKNERLKSEYQQQLIKSSLMMPFTTVTGEYGQINSFYKDKSFGVSQGMSFPTVYKRQKEVYQAEWLGSVYQIGIQESLLKKHVTQVYYSLIGLQQKKVLLQFSDSIYSAFLEKSKIRFNKGESNLLEKTTAENQQGQIALQLRQLEHDVQLQQLEFQLLINTREKYIPESDFNVVVQIPILDSSSLLNHPMMKYWQQQKQIAASNTQLEKSKLSPDFSIGYNVMGMRGVGADNRDYNGSLRFHSAQISLGIPILTSGQKAKINAAKTFEKVMTNEVDKNLQELSNAFQLALVQYRKSEEALQYFNQTAIPNSKTMVNIAHQQFLNGEIDYLQWVILLNQVTTIQNDYIDALMQRNQAVAELNFYSQK